MPTNIAKPISFSSNGIKASWLSNVKDYYINEKSIVVNLGLDKAWITSTPETYLLPFSSSILKDVSIIKADSVFLITVHDQNNIGAIILDDHWHHLGELIKFPRDIPLWRSPQHELGIVEFDPYVVTGMSDENDPCRLKQYQVKVNLWYAPAQTSAAIHNKHADPDFLEVHTQIYGHGRMQKFHTKDSNTLYEDLLLSPGQTHRPMANIDIDQKFVYPWHQYYADENCIWMAIEFHLAS